MYGYDWSYYSPSKFYSDSPCFIHLDRLPNQGFGSVYYITKETAEAIKSAGTTKGFAGIVHSERLWIDIDTKGLSEERAIEKITVTEQKLNMMGVDYEAYDSGGHSTVGGAHFGVLRDAKPSHTLPMQDRLWAESHFKDVADTSIYTHIHLFRLPGNLHEDTGRPKELVYRKTGSSLTLPKYENRGQPIQFAPSSDSDVFSVFDNLRVMSSTVPQNNGNRHPTLVKLAYALKDSNVDPIHARWWLGETNKMFSEPKPDEELDGIVERVYK
jgi:hypothetical protein